MESWQRKGNKAYPIARRHLLARCGNRGKSARPVNVCGESQTRGHKENTSGEMSKRLIRGGIAWGNNGLTLRRMTSGFGQKADGQKGRGPD